MFNSIKYMKNKSNLKNINLFTISTPFLGSPLASPKVIFPVIKRVAGPIGIYWFNSVSSRNHLDFDIAVSGGMTEEFMDNYDPNFIKNILSDENISAIKKINFYQNITTLDEKGSLLKSFEDGVFKDSFLMFLSDKILLGGHTDGMVSYDSQNAVEKYLNTNHLHLEKSFHSLVVEDKEFTTIFLDDMYSVIDNKYKKIKKLVRNSY